MKLVTILVVLLAPAVLVHAAPNEGAPAEQVVALPANGQTYYVDACSVPTVLGAPLGLVEDCLLSGLYEESNGFVDLQAHAGVVDDAAYSPDHNLLA